MAQNENTEEDEEFESLIGAAVQPPSETIVVPATDGTPATATAPAIPATPATTAPNPEFSLWKKRDRFVLLWLQSTLPITGY
ncbi:hypothetical protein LXL04_006901 [Taraxacum kok-saghyz]